MKGKIMRITKWTLLILLLGSTQSVAQTTVDDGHQLCITSFPDGATVKLDGIQVQQDPYHTVTPMCLNKVSVGVHQISVSSPSSGWQTDTRTINVLDVDSNSRVRDTHLSFTLMPSLTTGPPGPSGISPVLSIGNVSLGAPSANLTGTPANPVLNLVLPPPIPSIIPGPSGVNGLSPVLGIGSVSIGSPNAWLSGTSSNPLLNLTLPAPIAGVAGANGAPGTTPVLTIGSVGVGVPSATLAGTTSNPILNLTLPPGVPGLAGPAGDPGANATPIYAGIWLPNKTYTVGQEILRDPSVGGSRGPFFNTTGLSVADPAADSTNWVYCCGTASLGYQPLILTGSIQGNYPAGSSVNLLNHTFNVDETKTITTLQVNSAQFQSAPSQVSGQCYRLTATAEQTLAGVPVSAVAAQQAGLQGCGDPPLCQFTSNCTSTVQATFTGPVSTVNANVNLGTPLFFQAVTYIVYNFTYSVPQTQTGAMTFTVLKNGVPTALTITVAIITDPTITLPNGTSISFVAGDTITLQASNPSTSNDGLVSGTWTLN